MVDPKRVAELFNRFCEDAGELFDDGEPLPAAAYPVALDAACKRIAELEAERDDLQADVDASRIGLDRLAATLRDCGRWDGQSIINISQRAREVIAELEADLSLERARFERAKGNASFEQRAEMGDDLYERGRMRGREDAANE